MLVHVVMPTKTFVPCTSPPPVTTMSTWLQCS